MKLSTSAALSLATLSAAFVFFAGAVSAEAATNLIVKPLNPSGYDGFTWSPISGSGSGASIDSTSFSMPSTAAAKLSSLKLSVIDSIPELGVEEVSLPAGVSEADTIQNLMDSGLFDYVEEDTVVDAAAFTPDDPDYTDGLQWQMPLLGFPNAWSVATGQGVTVAVLDTGVDCSSIQTDLVGKCVAGRNVVANNNNTADQDGHGTEVAGVAVAQGNNDNELAGAAYDAKIMPIKVADSSVSSALKIAKGIIWAANHGAQVANVSWGNTDSLGATVNHAACTMRAAGGLVFAGAGNNASKTVYPNPVVIDVVASTDQNDNRSSFSNYGAAVSLAAPGESIDTLWMGHSVSQSVTGTSFSSPMAAGVAALLFSANSALTPWQVEHIMFNTAKPIGQGTGYGRIDAGAALAQASTPPRHVNSAPQPPTITGFSGGSTQGYKLTWIATCDDQGAATPTYNVYQNGILIGTTANTYFKIPTLKAGSTYKFQISSVSKAGIESAKSEIDKDVIPDTNDNKNPTKPANLDASNVSGGVKLTWDSSNDNNIVAGYEVRRELTGSGSWSTIGSSGKLNYTDKSVVSNKKYDYEVRAYDTSGNLSAWSDMATIKAQ